MTAPAYSFRDAELRSPALRALNWAGARLARVGLDVPALTSEAIVGAARKRAASVTR